jgi:hypothetical protein
VLVAANSTLASCSGACRKKRTCRTAAYSTAPGQSSTINPNLECY